MEPRCAPHAAVQAHVVRDLLKARAADAASGGGGAFMEEDVIESVALNEEEKAAACRIPFY